MRRARDSSSKTVQASERGTVWVRERGTVRVRETETERIRVGDNAGWEKVLVRDSMGESRRESSEGDGEMMTVGGSKRGGTGGQRREMVRQ